MKHFRKLISIILILSLLCTTGITALGTEEAAQSLRFADVLPDAWYADEVAYVVDHGLMIGTSDDTFSPETRMSRAMLVTVLWRYEGSPEGYENHFTDVPAGTWYTDAVAWANAEQVVNGVGENRFSPNASVTREQMVTILHRYARAHDVDVDARDDLSAFSDADSVSDYARDAMQWAVAAGIINGSNGRLIPQSSATRAQVAAILYRYLEEVVPVEPEKPDYTALRSAIDAAEAVDTDSYTEDSVAALQRALAAAREALNADSQADVDAAAEALNNAVNGLVVKPVEPVKPDFSALQTAIDAAEAVGTDSYTEDSVAALQRALAAAREALNAETQADVDAAAEALRNAVNGLVVKPEEPADPTQVTVTGGTLTGRVTDDVYVYLGVPYARATERFVPATEATWDGVLEATSYGPISPQQSFFGGNDGQDNDCLNLNIWTNGVNDGARRPVMVWYHGGGMTSGSANDAQTNGRNLAAQEDVVVVTVNHRLGAMAYLDLSEYGEKYARSGNVGVLDMIASLQWIHDNIDRFGGDPDNVTIFGQSGGGAKVLALMTSPYAKGLFHKAINQSGATNTLGPVFATEEMARRVTELTLQSLNITADNIEQLQSISFNELNTAGSAALQQVAEEFRIESPFGGSWSFEWMPYVDGDIIPTHPVLEEGFAESGRDIPLLIGSNLNEWNFSMGGVPQDDAATLAALRQTYGDRAEQILEAFKTAYPNVAVGNATVVDTMLRAPLLEISRHKADQGGAPVYSYMLTYGAPQSVHGTEIPLIFDNTTAANEAMAATMRGIWAQFARTGSPAIEGLPAWDAFTRENGAVMVLDNECYLSRHHDTLIDLILGNSEPTEPSEYEVETPVKALPAHPGSPPSRTCPS